MKRVQVLFVLVALTLVTSTPAFAQRLHRLSGKAPRPSAKTAVTDFNGDGYADLAIGIPNEDVSGAVNAGAIHILYGSANGIQATAPDDQFWYQGGQGVGDAAEGGDKFGASVAAGDFNGDGYADVAVGVPLEDVGGVVDAGAVHVLYGSANRIQATSPDDQLWSQGSQGLGGATEANDQFGSALGVGDLNGDGYADLAVGVPLEDVGSVVDAGAVHVIYGSAAGLQATAPDDQLWSQDSPGVKDVAKLNDQFGFSVAAGDFNKDTFADLAIGVPNEDVGDFAPVRDAGSVSVLYGTAGGIQADAPDDQLWAQGRGGILDRAEADDHLGWSGSTGDFNGDGYTDLVAGAPYEDVGTESRGIDAGAVNMIYGSPAGLTSTGNQYWNQDSPNVIGLAEHQDHFGQTSAAGDFNGNGYDDLAVGVPNEDGGGEAIPQSGALNILYGSPGGIWTRLNWHMEQGILDMNDAAETRDHFGSAIDIGDWDGEGHADLAVGVPYEDITSIGNFIDIGAVHVVYSTAAGLQAVNPDDQLWTQQSPGMHDRGEWGDNFGWAIAGATTAH